jgi:hypothetical protein
LPKADQRAVDKKDTFPGPCVLSDTNTWFYNRLDHLTFSPYLITYAEQKT